MALQGLVPDFIIRPTIRALCRQRLREIDAGSFEANYKAKMEWIEGVRARSKIADLTEKANEQHYEVCGKLVLVVCVRQLDEMRFRCPPISSCRALGHMRSTRPACTQTGQRPSRRRRS